MNRPSATRLTALLALTATTLYAAPAPPPSHPGSKTAAQDKETVTAEHDTIGAQEDKTNSSHTLNADAQWYPDAGLGLFLHWGVASVSARNISWPMIPGRPLAKKKLTPDELARVLKDRDYNLDGKPPTLTPNIYWSDAPKFNPDSYDPEKWCKAAKEAGFEYVVLTTKHHEGFALWPSAYGDFNTKTWMGGRDLVKEFVEACRHNHLKVGLYFSGPDWHFDRDYMSFLYGGARKKNPDFPSLDGDLNPRTTKHTPEEIAQHQKEFTALFKGQLEELLTHYGKIDLLWFDGKPNIPNASSIVSLEHIRELQPGIVVNPRLHGHGDFVTYERTMPAKKTTTGWAEYCNTWGSAWPYVKGQHYRSDGFVLGQLAECRAKGINYLLGIGPMSNGELEPQAYENMAVLAKWMKSNGPAIHAVMPLPAVESASIPATTAGTMRYLYAIPQFKNGGNSDAELLPPTDMAITLKGTVKPATVTLLGDGSPLEFTYTDKTTTIQLPASRRTNLVDVVAVRLPEVEQ